MTRRATSVKAQVPFRFYTSFVLQEPTGLRAATLSQLATLLKKVPEACIYHHTHYSLLSHHYLIPEPTNDFAYWVGEVLGEEALGERLASLDIMAHSSLDSLREALVRTVEDHLARTPAARFRFASDGEEFFFVKSVHVVMPTRHQACTLPEFARALSQVSIHSLYHHMFEARLRLGRKANDFSVWLGEQLELKELAEKVASLDPYGRTLEMLRSSLMSLVQLER